MDNAPTKVVKHHEIGEAPREGILTVANTYKDRVVPIAFDVLIPPIDAIHDFILDMNKQTLIKLKVGIRSHTKIMVVFIV